ncbi:MAG: hypothetical protein GAK28_02450 [Luteibacter sp.]|uniref:immunity 22 family protein n=1 Tax=Luteibacter sp. TaxID=1886636 RepID=UPI00137E0C46|nr:immunity 22 family protein [Luteibacter sp.]KAF1006432.1 MAG: hypothetical protein GAK28_02450 [Luteibacter sp.]
MRTTETSHFYLGRVTDPANYAAFLAEHYDREDDEEALSAFYASQGETFCDHDFMETGERAPDLSLKAFFAPHSYASEWSGAVCAAAREHELDDATLLLFISSDQIAAPRSVKGDGFELIYIGSFDYRI